MHFFRSTTLGFQRTAMGRHRNRKQKKEYSVINTGLLRLSSITFWSLTRGSAGCTIFVLLRSTFYSVPSLQDSLKIQTTSESFKANDCGRSYWLKKSSTTSKLEHTWFAESLRWKLYLDKSGVYRDKYVFYCQQNYKISFVKHNHLS